MGCSRKKVLIWDLNISADSGIDFARGWGNVASSSSEEEEDSEEEEEDQKGQGQYTDIK